MSGDGPTTEQSTGARMVLGLGNPGPEFAGSRHNRGRDVVEALARTLDMQLDTRLCNARVGRRGDLVLATPETYMNRSGHAARCLADRFAVADERLLVVYDDVALPLGTLRLRPRGGPGGQRGMASVIESLRTDRLPRLRLGIRPDISDTDLSGDLTEFVLGPFADAERASADEQLERGVEACLSWLENGTEVTMNRFNASPAPAAAIDPED